MDISINNIASFCRDVDSIQSAQALCQFACESVVDSLHLEDYVIYLRDSDNYLVQVAAHGKKLCPDEGIVSPLRLAEGQGIVGSAARKVSNQLVSDTSQASNYIVDDEHRLSELAVPIRFQGEAIGVMDSEHPEANFFKQEHEWFMESISSIIAPRISQSLKSPDNPKNEIHPTSITTSENYEHECVHARLERSQFYFHLNGIIKSYHKPQQWNESFLSQCKILDATANNPLARITYLKSLINDTVKQMKDHKKTSIWADLLAHRYIHDKVPQTQLADYYNMGFSTFRRHQSQALEHLISQLWLREESL
ncbi:GAF domain-containing protein [Aliikangiella marina]|uniref:GAF domain-containing protein n=1 Tax=Aliikangiella marina TaxID=1712262 RepID=A0A545T9R9_9GAMM|nr:GAF domain-containing protein [Aliikangiella marina]TQV73956.1 GAF domain-containing protein [Aliikangiella marina]